MFLFKISGYEDPALDAETEELLRQRLEAHSRRTMPGMWKATDRLNAYAARGPSREKRRGCYRVYGVLLLALGIFALVPGLMEPRTPSLIVAGAAAVISGLVEFCLAREKKLRKAPAVCRKEAQGLLAGLRAVDWSKRELKICFEEAGMSFIDGGNQEIVPYDKIGNIFEGERLWLFIYDGEKALLLQKADLIAGGAEDFSAFLHEVAR